MCIRYCGTGIAVLEALCSCVATVLPPDSSTVCDTAAGLSCPYITKGFLQVRIPLLSCTLLVSAVTWETA